MKIANVRGGRGKPPQVILDGTYIVIDPCYVDCISAEWDSFHAMWEWNKYEDHNGHEWVLMELDGRVAVMFLTASGDGLYPVKQNGELVGEAGVDSGSLAFIPTNIDGAIPRDLGVKVEICGFFKCKEGNAQVGNVLVLTGDDDVDQL